MTAKPSDETVSIHITWEPRWKRYNVTWSWTNAAGRRQASHLPMDNAMRAEIDEAGAYRLIDALRAEYASWLF